MYSLAILSTFAVVASATFVPRAAEYDIKLKGRDQGRSPLEGRSEGGVATTRIDSKAQLIYDITVQLGSIDTTLLVDSGSFSLWTVQSNYSCTDGYNVFPRSKCNLLPSWSPEADKTAKRWDNINYYEGYGSGWAQGVAYNTSVTIAGITVDDYPIGYASQAEFSGGDGVASGIIGLGLGVATGFANSTWGPIAPTGLFTLLKDKLSSWQFAITLEPGTGDGYTMTSTHGELALGGLSAHMLEAIDKDPFATANISAADTKNGWSYWGGVVDGWTYPNTSDNYNPAKPFSKDVLFDSGTAFMALDRGTFAWYNSLWTGTPELRRTNETNSPKYYFIDCLAWAPDLSIIINGQYLNISSSDLIFRYPNGTCMSAVTEDTNSPHFILGAPFFKSNVVVFDGDARAIHAAQKVKRPQE